MSYRIYAVLGDYYHDPELSARALREAASKLAVASDVEVVPYKELAQCLVDQPDVLVLFKEERLDPEAEDVGQWMDESLQQLIVDYVETGGALLAWHSGLAYHNDSIYRQMLRGWFVHHPEQKPVSYQTISGNQITTLSTPFSFKDEHYFVHCEEAETEVFLRSESEDGRSIAGWAHDHGQGRVCCVTPAHTVEGLTHSSVIQLITDCLAYCLRRTAS